MPHFSALALSFALSIAGVFLYQPYRTDELVQDFPPHPFPFVSFLNRFSCLAYRYTHTPFLALTAILHNTTETGPSLFPWKTSSLENLNFPNVLYSGFSIPRFSRTPKFYFRCGQKPSQLKLVPAQYRFRTTCSPRCVLNGKRTLRFLRRIMLKIFM